MRGEEEGGRGRRDVEGREERGWREGVEERGWREGGGGGKEVYLL